MALITCRDLVVGYEGKPILPPLNFSVNAGDYLCIVGENGSGKTTLMRTLLGLQPPLGGDIITGDGLKKNKVGYLPQQTNLQKDFPASVWEVILSGCQNMSGYHPFYSREEKDKAHTYMHSMGLEVLQNHSYRDLSGGQQQRVLLARALCATDSLLLMDEPVAGLDAHYTTQMYETIETLNRDKGITVIMITHDLEAAVKYASHILHIGKDLFFGTKEEYISSRSLIG
ncbi:MAG: ATP-binding cassette domain-containing protein [Clostridia bacterium]|nr:ATP-binding cassette domain-containing protein [Clostridia bacterium]